MIYLFERTDSRSALNKMRIEFSKPLDELPAFLSTVANISDSRSDTIQRFINAERKSPRRYDPASDLFIRALEGNFTIGEALGQARNILDPVKRKCAVEVLQASKSFLNDAQHGPIGRFPAMSIPLPCGMELNVSPVWIRHLDPDKLLILHFWRKSLSERQISAVTSILQLALSLHQPRYVNCELDLISVSKPDFAPGRRLIKRDWTSANPLNNEERKHFLELICDIWCEYRKREPRVIRRKDRSDLFS